MELQLNYKSIFRVAFPIMMGSFVQFLVNFTNTAFVGQLGETELNAVGNAGLLYITLFVVAQGYSAAIQVLVARRKGQNKLKQIGLIFDHSFLTLLALSLLLFLVVGWFCKYHLGLVIANKDIASAMSEFMAYRVWGYFFSIMQVGIVGYYMGIARTRILFYSTAITALLNIFLDYALIYGKFGFPNMGIAGAALSSTISEAASLAFVMVYLLRDKDSKTYHLLRFKKIKTTIFIQISKLAYPLVGQRFISLLAWTVFFFMIEKTNSHDLAVSQIIRSLYFLAFIPIMGYGSATSTFVSHYMANYDHVSVIKVMKKVALVSAISTFVFVHGYLFYPRPIISLITSDINLVNDTVPILRLIITSMLLHSGVMVLFSAVSGIGDTKASFWIEASAIFIYLIYAYFVCVYKPQSLYVIWASEFIYFGLLALFSIAYFKWANWKTYRI